MDEEAAGEILVRVITRPSERGSDGRGVEDIGEIKTAEGRGIAVDDEEEDAEEENGEVEEEEKWRTKADGGGEDRLCVDASSVIGEVGDEGDPDVGEVDNDDEDEEKVEEAAVERGIRTRDA